MIIAPRQQILILDDDRFFTHLVRRLLTRNNHVVEECSEPSRLDPTRLAGFDLILLDVMMPTVDGLQMLEVIRKYAPDTSVVLTTAIDQSMIDRIILQSAKIGIRLIGVLNKPFKSADLTAMIESNACYSNAYVALTVTDATQQNPLAEERTGIPLHQSMAV